MTTPPELADVVERAGWIVGSIVTLALFTAVPGYLWAVHGAVVLAPLALFFGVMTTVLVVVRLLDALTLRRWRADHSTDPGDSPR